MPAPIAHLARQVVAALADRGQRIVLAESCTGGLVAATLATVPGVSDWLCGSAVTYRSDTKIQWLKVDAQTIAAHTAVSQQVSREMAARVLERTPEADWSTAITGHLGPNAPTDIDGVIFVAMTHRDHNTIDVSRHQLASTDRVSRQQEAVETVLRLLLERL